MANYTISKFTTTETIGDSVFHNNMISSGTLTITPNANYVLSASNFSTNALPSNVSSVVFTDTTTAGKIGNKVTVTVNLSSDVSVTASIDIKLNIIGDATIYNPENETVSAVISIDDHVTINTIEKTDKNGSSAYTAEDGFTINTTTANSIETSVITATLTKNTRTKVGSLVITADSGYYFRKLPYLKISSLQKNIIKIESTSVTRDSNNFITAYTFDIICSSDIDILANSNINASLFYEAIKAPTITKEIKGVYFGRNTITSIGETKAINVISDVDAEFDIVVVKNSDKSSILSSENANSTAFTADYGTISCINHKTKVNRGNTGNSNLTFIQEFPAATDTYYIDVYPKSGTTLSSSFPIIRPHYTITQHARPTLTITRTNAGNAKIVITEATAITYKGELNTSTNRLDDNNNFKKRFKLNWTFTCSGGTFTGVTKQPTFSSTDASASDFSNSTYADNGGTHIEIFNLVASVAHGGASATITGDVLIKKWGTGTPSMSIETSSIFATT